MSRFEMKLNDTPDWAEHDWLVFEDGVMVAGFAGSNAAERFIARCEAAVAIEKEIDRAARRSPSMSGAERRRIHALLRGRH